jgi:hypothetical protein
MSRAGVCAGAGQKLKIIDFSMDYKVLTRRLIAPPATTV